MKSISILRLTAILLCSMHLLGSASLQAQMNKWVNYSPDLTTVLKNPAMGWMMYEEADLFREHATIKATSILPKFFGNRWKNAKQLIIPIFCTSECCGKIWNPRRANMHGFTMNGINGIYKKPKTKGLNWPSGCSFMV